MRNYAYVFDIKKVYVETFEHLCDEQLKVFVTLKVTIKNEINKMDIYKLRTKDVFTINYMRHTFWI